MKRIVLAVLILGLMTVPAFAIETVLDVPMALVTPAKVAVQHSFTIVPSENAIRALIRFKDASDNLIDYQKECEFIDPAISNAVITSNMVGKKYIDVMSGFIQTKCKGLWNMVGTDQ